MEGSASPSAPQQLHFLATTQSISAKQKHSCPTTWFSLWQHRQFPIEIWSFDLNAYKFNTFQLRNISPIDIVEDVYTRKSSTRKTTLSQRLWHENFVDILNSFIRLTNQVTNVRVVKRTRHKKYIDRLPLCVLRSFELFFIGLCCGVSVWASRAVERLKEIRLRSLTVFPWCVFCRMFLRRNKTRTTRIPWFNAN